MSSALYLCLHVRDFAAQSLISTHSELRSRPVAVLSGEPPLESVFAVNAKARGQGVQLGMSRMQAASFAVTLLHRNRGREDSAFSELMECAQQFSPRIEVLSAPEEERCGATLVLDVSGSERLLGNARKIATVMRGDVQSAGYEASTAASRNAYAAVLAARGMREVTVIPSGYEADILSPMSLAVLELETELAQTFAVWGIRTLGELAALPAKALVARVGEIGHQLQALARGEFEHLLVPAEGSVDAPFRECVELEAPVELLEPLLFLLDRMLEQATQRVGQRSLAIASVEVILALEGDNGQREEFRRTVRPALPERDHHTLLKLIQLDLEMHPPGAAVVGLQLEVRPARPQIVQNGLFVAQTPEAGRLEVLLARLRKLVGEERIGAPELLDTHAPDAFRITSFAALDNAARATPQPRLRVSALRMMRPPLALRIVTSHARPVALFLEGRRIAVETCSGPWRTDGAWWTNSSWSREEWDVEVKEQPRRCLRLAYDPGADCWYVIGAYD